MENSNDIENVLNEYCPKIESKFSLAPHLDQIDKCFDAMTIEDILRKLQEDNTKWAKQTIEVKNYVKQIFVFFFWFCFVFKEII